MKKLITLLTVLLLFTGCNEAKVKSVNYEEAKNLIDNENAILMDVRTQVEYNVNHIEGAILVSSDSIDEKIEELVIDKETKIIVYCQSGTRSKAAAEVLLEHGYKNVYDLGSIDNWKE